MSRFAGKRALIMGVANKRSIAWAIAKRLADEGAELAFTFQGERIEANVRELASSVGSELVTPCDVPADEDVERVFGEVAQRWDGQLDLLVHSVAFAAAEDLEGRFTDTPRDRFWMAVDISAYSLVAASRAAEPLMAAAGGGSIVTMTYLGGERAVPHYNVMGVAKATLDASVKYLAWDLGEQEIRVNAVSAGPVRTLAARSIAGFTEMESMFVERAPLGVTSMPVTSPRHPPTCSPTTRRTSPARRSTSTPATTRWGCRPPPPFALTYGRQVLGLAPRRGTRTSRCCAVPEDERSPCRREPAGRIGRVDRRSQRLAPCKRPHNRSRQGEVDDPGAAGRQPVARRLRERRSGEAGVKVMRPAQSPECSAGQLTRTDRSPRLEERSADIVGPGASTATASLPHAVT